MANKQCDPRYTDCPECKESVKSGKIRRDNGSYDWEDSAWETCTRCGGYGGILKGDSLWDVIKSWFGR